MIAGDAARNDVYLLLQASVELVGNVVAYKIQVDDSVMQVNISVGMVSKGIISLKRPGGSLVQVGQPGVSITDTVGARVFTVSAPAMGEWTIEVSRTGTTLIAASAFTPLYLHKFDFVALTGRTEHVGYFPLEGNPISGKTQTMRASLFGVDNGLQFSFRRPNGSLIAPFSMVAGNLNAVTKQDFIGEVVPPSETFLVDVNGVTATGRPFQRVYPGQQSTSAVEMRLSSDLSAVPAGRQTQVAFSITNYGPANTFSFSALDTKGFLVGTAPAAIALGPDESKTVTISVLAPAGTPEGTQFSITLVATGTLRRRLIWQS